MKMIYDEMNKELSFVSGKQYQEYDEDEQLKTFQRIKKILKRDKEVNLEEYNKKNPIEKLAIIQGSIERTLEDKIQELKK